MNAFGEIRLRARRMVVPTIGICLLGYIAFHVVQGERGLLAWWRIQKDIQIAEASLGVARTERLSLEARVGLMRPESLDLDMLDEQVREVLGLVREDEKLVLPKTAPGQGQN